MQGLPYLQRIHSSALCPGAGHKALWVEMLDSTAPGTVAESSVNKLGATFKAERATELAKIAQAQPDNQNAQAEAPQCPGGGGQGGR